MKTRLLKRVRKNAKKNVLLTILTDGEFAVKSDLGWYTQGLSTYYFQKKFGHVVFSTTLHEAKNILSDARRLYMKEQLMKVKVKKYQKIIKKL